MADADVGRVGRQGTVTLPAALRERFGLREGAPVIAEERPDGILIRPAPVDAGVETGEAYAPDRIAAFLLENAVDAADYAAARADVRALGLDPDRIPHEPPGDLPATD